MNEDSYFKETLKQMLIDSQKLKTVCILIALHVLRKNFYSSFCSLPSLCFVFFLLLCHLISLNDYSDAAFGQLF